MQNYFMWAKRMKSSWKQEEINNLLLKCAREEGKITLRLKGGDPLVFGRGSEEALFLKEHGIASEIVPGISSSIGGLIYGECQQLTEKSQEAFMYLLVTLWMDQQSLTGRT